MGIRGAAITLALLAAFVAVGAVRDLSSYSSSLDFSSLDFHGGSGTGYISHEVKPFRSKKVVAFYDPVKKTLRKKVPKKPDCEEGYVVVKTDEGIFKCVNKKEEVPVEVVEKELECLEGETLDKGPDGKLICVFTCPEGQKAEEGPEGKPACVVVSCPEGLTLVEGACVFTCPEGFKQIGDTQECEEDIPVVENVTVPEEPAVVEEPVEVEAVVVPEVEAEPPLPEVLPVEPTAEVPVPSVTIPEIPEIPEPVPEVPVVTPEPVPEVPVVTPEPVPEVPVVTPEPVPETPSVEVQTVPEEPGTCPVGEFFMDKVEARGCQACDANCGEGSCADFTGCDVCAPGFFTQREDLDWPFECVLCESVIPGCTKCKNGITLELGQKTVCEG